MKTTFNIKAKYILVAQISNNEEIYKFIISNFNGKRRKVNKEEFIGMVARNSIANCQLQNNQLKGMGMTLRHIPTYNKNTGESYRAGKEDEIIAAVNDYKNSKIFSITARVFDRRQCIGYEVANLEGKTAIFTKDNTIKLIEAGYVGNVTYQLYDGRDYIKGVGFNINKLKTIKLDENISNIIN